MKPRKSNKNKLNSKINWLFNFYQINVNFIYIYIKRAKAATVLRYCALVFALCKHGSCNRVLVRHFYFILFFFQFRTVATVPQTVATVVTFFFFLPFVLFFPLYILFYYTINFTIFLQLLMCQFLIS